MVVQCPSCLGRYKVADENRVPLEGVGVKCPGCGNIFTIFRMVSDIELIPLETAAPGPSDKPTPAYEPSATPEPSVAAPEAERFLPPEEEPLFHPKPPVFEPEPPPDFAETATQVIPETEKAPAPPPEIGTAAPEAPAAALPTAEAGAELPPDVQKQHNKAKRLARVLVKDIVLYHGERVEEGLKKGNLIDTVGDEIKKSWQYYKSEIPEGIINSTDYFKDALNQILARGKEIFT